MGNEERELLQVPRCDVRAAVTAARFGRLYESETGIKIKHLMKYGDSTNFNRDSWGRAALEAGFIERLGDWSFRATEAGIVEFGLPPYRPEAADA